ncbi:DNA-methyltransferase [Agriterribacter humi]|uniref:DNA-methyltransferase n=1 Tax=Agriterribacter humi TaxID=1104781 RepID=UPI001264B4B6|nr:site-specific DNA-methyltransferase [Agriterribacter humi]
MKDEKLVNQYPVYTTAMGGNYQGDSLDLMKNMKDESIDLIFTSPPFALLRKKEYGNRDQSEYIDWLAEFAKIAYQKLKSTGSFVLDLGGAYQKGVPIRSLYNFRIPIKFCDEIGFHLAEDFYWFNPSKLPSPIEWVNKRKIRVKDAVNTVWWFSKTEWPKADVRNVLVEYSDRMKKLIKDPKAFYNPAIRPSGHDIGESFGNDNGGAIPSNLLQISNSESNSNYLGFCKQLDLKGHPARFPLQLPEFFIKFLTDENDLVVDIFSGSNTTGQACEKLNRRWLSIDLDLKYIAASSFRFLPRTMEVDKVKGIYDELLANKRTVDLSSYQKRASVTLFDGN